MIDPSMSRPIIHQRSPHNFVNTFGSSASPLRKRRAVRGSFLVRASRLPVFRVVWNRFQCDGPRGQRCSAAQDQAFTADGVRLTDPSNPQLKIGYVTSTTTTSRFFSQVGIVSAGMSGGAETEPMATLAANPAKANQLIDLLWIACRKEDAALKGAKTLHHALEQAGVEHTYLETDGAHHWRIWRRYRRDLAPLLFK